MAIALYILNGPNLNLLGTREPEVYGKATLADIEKLCRDAAKKHGFEIVFRQTNVEGELVDWLHEARTKAAGVVLNAGAYTHTSIAIHDALKATTMPVVEVHLSNPFARESFRHHSYISSVAQGVICGFGAQGYVFAIDALADLLANAND
ncbi:MAG TPA: type II 3-dehydroquinate dehydratase [Pseudolabrys sp.]|nr:type II 3-dehydroquinate dehydratase [Pseudolabrys sp.]